MAGIELNAVQQAVGTGYTAILGRASYPLWVIISNDDVPGAITGTTCVLQVYPVQGPPLTVFYGEIRHFYFPKGVTHLVVTGNGAIVDVIVSDIDVPRGEGLISANNRPS